MFKALNYIFGRSDRLRFVLLLILMLLASVMEICTLGAVPLFISMLVDDGTMRLTESVGVLACKFGILDTRENLAICGGLLLILLFIIRTAYTIFTVVCQEHIIRNRLIALSSRVFQAYLYAPYAMQRMRNSSSITDYVCTESYNIMHSVLNQSLSIIRNLVIVCSALGLMLCFAPGSSLLAFAVLVLAGGGFMVMTNRKLKEYGENAFAGRQCMYKTISEGIGINREATLTDRRGHFASRLHHGLEQYATAEAQHNMLRNSIWPSMELLTVSVILGTMGLMLVLGYDMVNVAPALGLLAVCLARLKGCFTELMIGYSSIRTYYPVLESLYKELWQLENGVREEKNGGRLEFKDKIQVCGLSFAYPDSDNLVLSGVNFEILKGESVAFIGATGSGKSTMAELLLGLFAPSGGKICVDGVDIAENLSGWRRHLGFVPQDIFLLDDSIRENITLGDENVDEAALKNAIASACLEDFIAGLPQGDKSIVGERGTRLSGGQRQRIGIARALYRNPSVLVFDEATSALDNETEAVVMGAIEKLKGKHTLVIVAHRLSTIKGCAKVFRFENGGIRAGN